jgi:hypothetical protein
MVSPADARPEAAPPPSESEPSRPDLAGDAAAAASASAGAASASMDDKPTVAIVIGMAGSGKTSLMQRVNAYKHAQGKPPYIINLDPAVTQTPYDANVDIRDTVDYKNVMKEYNLRTERWHFNRVELVRHSVRPGGFVVRETIEGTGQRLRRHPRADRDLHLVGERRHRDRELRVGVSHRRAVRRGHPPRAEPAELHEQHVTGGVHPVQNQASPDCGVQQNRRREARNHDEMDGGFRDVPRRAGRRPRRSPPT